MRKHHNQSNQSKRRTARKTELVIRMDRPSHKTNQIEYINSAWTKKKFKINKVES